MKTIMINMIRQFNVKPYQIHDVNCCILRDVMGIHVNIIRQLLLCDKTVGYYPLGLVGGGLLLCGYNQI